MFDHPVSETISEVGPFSFYQDHSITHSSGITCHNCRRLIKENNVLRSEAGYWKNCHQRALERETFLKQEIAKLKAKIKLRERQLFGRKSEKGVKGRGDSEQDKHRRKKRKRGQQPGFEGHGRRLHKNLPEKEEFWELSKDEQKCSYCGLPFEPQGGTEDSELVEVNVRAHRRKIRRRRYRRTCSCPGMPQIITAPGPPKLIPKGGYGISFWVYILLGKFLYQSPLYRILAELRDNHALDISQGTVTGGLERLRPLFVPLYHAIMERNITEGRWHADETRWLVFAEMEGKLNHKWYLWLFCSSSTVVYRLEPTRASDIPLDHFGKEAEGILNVDRYSAYKVLLKENRILLAYCWAHVRRDFLAIAKDWPRKEEWAFEWVERIGELYRLNEARLEALKSSGDFDAVQTELCYAVEAMAKERDDQLADPKLYSPCRKVIESLKRHWSGLILFLEHPEVPMDNNKAERTLRGPVVGRKNYYGTGSFWSGALTIMLFSLFQTLQLANINPRLWLTAYLEACAEQGCRPPLDAAGFLPWNLDKERLRFFQNSQPVVDDTS